MMLGIILIIYGLTACYPVLLDDQPWYEKDCVSKVMTDKAGNQWCFLPYYPTTGP